MGRVSVGLVVGKVLGYKMLHTQPVAQPVAQPVGQPVGQAIVSKNIQGATTLWGYIFGAGYMGATLQSRLHGATTSILAIGWASAEGYDYNFFACSSI